MKLVMTLLVRDEADILAQTIDFHLAAGVDHILAMDNLSVDATPDILDGYVRRGVLTYIPQPQDDYAQGEWVTAMARTAVRDHAADWVINSDADEFWWPQGGDLKVALAAQPPEVDAVRVERTNFLPPPPGAPRAFYDTMTIRERQSLNALGAPLPPKACHRGALDVVVGQGNHEVSRPGRAVVVGAGALEILHFPLRGYTQFARKIAAGGAAYRRNTVLPPGVGATWRRLYEVFLDGGLPAHYAAQRPDPAAIARGLEAGDLLQDTRLRDALRTLAAA